MDTAVETEVPLHERGYAIVLNSLGACCKSLHTSLCSGLQAAFLVQS